MVKYSGYSDGYSKGRLQISCISDGCQQGPLSPTTATKWNLRIYHIGLGFISFWKLVYLIQVLLFLSVSSSCLVSETVSLTGLTISCNKTSDWLILGQVNFEKCDHILESWWVRVLNNSVGPKRLAKGGLILLKHFSKLFGVLNVKSVCIDEGELICIVKQSPVKISKISTRRLI